MVIDEELPAQVRYLPDPWRPEPVPLPDPYAEDPYFPDPYAKF